MKVLTLLCLVVLAAGVLCQKDPNLVPGSAHGVMVHLFEWKFPDIAAECERFLGPNGFGAVQVSPIHENLIVTSPFRPWWERYQLVSYNLNSRSGDEAAFRDMVNRCNNAGVRIYVDVVLNQMTGSFSNARGQGGNVAYPDSFQYPGVPYGPLDFHNPTCGISTTDYTNSAANVRNCELNGLHDLNQTSPYVRNIMINYLNHLVDCGIAGFRVDAAKHMWPADLEYIYSKVNDLSTSHGFPSGTRPFFYQEAIDLGTEAIKSTEYTDFGRVMEFRYSRDIGNAFRGNNAIKYLKNFGEAWGYVPSGDAVSFVDNHDNQRGHGAGGPSILTYKDAKLYKMAVAFMLSYTYGFPRVMSSFYFDNTDQGPPADSNGNIISPAINSQGTCDNGWVCEHRWRQVYNMVAFRNAVEGNGVTNWWDNDNKQIAFGRGCKGFIAFNNEFGQDLKQTLQTCLPSGVYCDVISGSLQNGACTGKKVTVQSDGKAYIEILNSEDDGVLAIHVQSKQS